MRNLVLGLVAALTIGVGLLVTGYVLANGQSDQGAILAQIQKERVRNTLIACERTNREHAAIIGFIEQSIPDRRRKDPRGTAYLALARKTFPQVDCQSLVRKQVQQ